MVDLMPDDEDEDKKAWDAEEAEREEFFREPQWTPEQIDRIRKRLLRQQLAVAKTET